MTNYNDETASYITQLFAPQDTALQHAKSDSLQRGLPAISIQPEEGKFLQFLVRSCGAKKAVEIGTLGGYSGIWIGRGLMPHGQLITLEKDPTHAEVAAEHFISAGLGQTVEVRLGDAFDSLKTLAAEGPFDFVFIDADKASYQVYYEWAMDNLRVGGIVAAHNAFRNGAVIDMDNLDLDTQTIRNFNQRAAVDPRGLSILYPAGDGMVAVIKINS
jgi:predicted O-methyltransferase YrrM